jgi:hypothetical protein
MKNRALTAAALQLPEMVHAQNAQNTTLSSPIEHFTFKGSAALQ